MKKVGIFLGIGLMALLTSCQKYEAKTVQLNNMNDSLNYTLGLANGAGIKQYYLASDSTNDAIPTLMKALEKAYAASDEEADNEMFELGKNIGASFKQMEKEGLMGDKTLAFDKELTMQGLVNALNKFDKGMQGDDASSYLQNTMRALREAQQKAMEMAAPAVTEEQPVDTASFE